MIERMTSWRKFVTTMGVALLVLWYAANTVNITRNLSLVVSPLPRMTSLSPIPGGLVLRGTCDLRALRKQGTPVDIGMFVKHGLHSSELIPKSCKVGPRRLKVTRFTPGISKRKTGNPKRFPAISRVERFVSSDSSHKVLPVRSQTSFYKSVFNHVCNHDSSIKRSWRERHHVNCTREGELARLLGLNEMELAYTSSPFLLKEIILRSPGINNVMLFDYKCLPTIVKALCDEPMPSYDNMTVEEKNSAADQNYTDYWALHNYSSFLPFNPFWDEIYERLKETCCLEFARFN